MMRPFWCYYGGKWILSKRYPVPRHDLIIEPFAGAAGYSVRHNARNVLLFDVNPQVTGTWQYLIDTSAEEIRRLPLYDGTWERTSDLTHLPQEARWLIGWWLNKGMTAPCNVPGKWMREDLRPGIYWDATIRDRIASQVDQIRHWRILPYSYANAPLMTNATYFVDPPYANAAGRRYAQNTIDYDALGRWCEQIPGQAIVCENEGATWLPFRPFMANAPSAKNGGRELSSEMIWTN